MTKQESPGFIRGEQVNDEDELLGCIIAGADPTDLGIHPGEFADLRNEWIFRACLAVAETGRRCDPQTVLLELTADQLSKIPDGPLHLVNLAQHAIPANATAYARKVRNATERRALLDVAYKIHEGANDPESDPGDLRESARGWLERPDTADDGTRSMADLFPEYVDGVESGDAPGLSTPWPDLDWYLHGLHPGRLYTIGGRPGGGKSVMMSNIAAHFAIHHGAPVFFSTLEMPEKELVGRITAAISGVSQTNLLTRRLTEGDWGQIEAKSAVLAGMPLHINDQPQTVQSIRRYARNVKRRQGLGLVVVDYLQLMTPNDRRISRQQQIGEITRGLKALAKELEVPVVTASQLRRPKNPKDEPTMDDLRESGDIESDSDGVILLHNEDEQKPWNLTAFVRKNRAGPRGSVDLFFDTGRARMNSSEWRKSA